MTRRESGSADPSGPATLVWIDSDEALIVRWDGAAAVERVASDVPARRRSTGHVRHDPLIRHGGGGKPETRLDRVRESRLDAFLGEVAARVPPLDAVRIVGPGLLRHRLDRLIRSEDERLGRMRAVDSRSATPLTEPQLVAAARDMAGDPARRRTVG